MSGRAPLKVVVKRMNNTPDTLDKPPKVTASELRGILSSCKVFTNFTDNNYDELTKEAKREFAPAGTQLLKQGNFTETVTVLEHGRFLVCMPARTGETLTFELGRGEVVALASGLGGEPLRGDLYALRDSTVINIRHDAILACLITNPQHIVDYSRWAIEQTQHLIGRTSPQSRPQAFALFPTCSAAQAREVAEVFMLALQETTGPGHLIDSQRVQEVLGCDPAKENEFERVRPKLTSWLEEQEAEGHFLLFLCDPTETIWTRWCLYQTDRIIVAVGAKDTSQIQRIDQMFAGRKVAETVLQVELILIQDKNTELPRGSSEWTNLKCRRRQHQVRQGNLADFKSAARRISDQAVGLVLGGGGARGLAHIGVLQALEEAGIPVDVIGGTSMGAVMAAAYARGWAPSKILEFASETFSQNNAVTDLDLPMISILAGRKLNRRMQAFFEEIEIADLWLPFFCIASSLSEGEMVVHDKGLLWERVRASCSLPGIFPPVRVDGQLLVDGGVMNNVPIDVMNRRCPGGTVIAVNVGGGGASGVASSNYWNYSGWGHLRHRLTSKPKNKRVANIIDILLWTTTLSSKRHLQQIVASGMVDLYLTPPVQGFELLGFDAFEKLYEIGYEYTRQRLETWQDLRCVTYNS